jgi:tetratricopeptide (TPR) repeat protein
VNEPKPERGDSQEQRPRSGGPGGSGSRRPNAGSRGETRGASGPRGGFGARGDRSFGDSAPREGGPRGAGKSGPRASTSRSWSNGPNSGEARGTGRFDRDSRGSGNGQRDSRPSSRDSRGSGDSRASNSWSNDRGPRTGGDRDNRGGRDSRPSNSWNSDRGPRTGGDRDNRGGRDSRPSNSWNSDRGPRTGGDRDNRGNSWSNDRGPRTGGDRDNRGNSWSNDRGPRTGGDRDNRGGRDSRPNNSWNSDRGPRTGGDRDNRVGRDSRPNNSWSNDRGPRTGGDRDRNETFRARPPRREEIQGFRAPALPKGLDLRDLPRGVRAELRSLSPEKAETVGGHLLMAGRLIDEDPAAAHQHALAAKHAASRLPIVREAVGETAYASASYAEALAEFRALRRMTGTDEYVPAMADCERALGRYQAALKLVREGLATQPELPALVELRLVEAGVRAETGQLAEALRLLQAEIEATGPRGPKNARARLRYAYADLLENSGQVEAAERWFEAAAGLDPEDSTDAADRVARLRGVVIEFDDSDDEFEDDESTDDALASDTVEEDGDAIVLLVEEPAEEPAIEQAVGEETDGLEGHSVQGEAPAEAFEDVPDVPSAEVAQAEDVEGARNEE